MICEGKLKRAAITAAVDIALRRMKKSPKRCARNLMELGLCAYPDNLPAENQEAFFQKLFDLIKKDDLQSAKELFSSVFL